ncbi:hypothetical protein H6P81_004596 [Aristolochia fimbriata]|uniref:Uncharacterized protein n=1 Tax=Aristolochia fimbriata TaxID=158543 RepID=A0AAV7EVQ6_ARIFI|nr:hypothetical protein H6P81_004596 [Aristolochia fimbriata]
MMDIYRDTAGSTDIHMSGGVKIIVSVMLRLLGVVHPPVVAVRLPASTHFCFIYISGLWGVLLSLRSLLTVCSSEEMRLPEVKSRNSWKPCRQVIHQVLEEYFDPVAVHGERLDAGRGDGHWPGRVLGYLFESVLHVTTLMGSNPELPITNIPIDR